MRSRSWVMITFVGILFAAEPSVAQSKVFYCVLEHWTTIDWSRETRIQPQDHTRKSVARFKIKVSPQEVSFSQGPFAGEKLAMTDFVSIEYWKAGGPEDLVAFSQIPGEDKRILQLRMVSIIGSIYIHIAICEDF